MTLRHRLMLVYLVVVLLSVVTAGVALVELERARRIYGPLQQLNDMVLAAQKLNTAFASPDGPATEEEERDFRFQMADQNRRRSATDEYLNLDRAREILIEVHQQYVRWSNLDPEQRRAEIEAVRRPLRLYAAVVDSELAKLISEAAKQRQRELIFLAVVICVTGVHILVVGWMLRHGLLRPMERLNRQVEALARDEVPREPLLASPREMANLAHALENARTSLRELRERLIEAERMTTIGQLAAQLAHNLRNPLASIRAAAQVTARESSAEPRTHERMTEIMASVDRLNLWIARLMEAARREPTPAQSVDVLPTLARVRDMLAPELNAKELTLELTAPQEGLRCVHDPNTLEHALIAMVTNAIEASPLAGRIIIRAEPLCEDSQPALCRISVVDQGGGLPVDHPERIFEFSYSTKQRGMGLGLALARLALQRQGGSTGATNNPAGGATVYIELPLCPGESI